MDEQRATPGVRPGLIGLLLFASGACALVFQVVWIRELRLIFGATTAASAAVVAVFMGGLGLGNALFGRRLDASRNPLAAYARLELGIAASAALTPFLIWAAQAAYVGLGGQESLGTVAAAAARLLATALILGLPTIFMGGTLPAAAKVVSAEADRQRRAVALVYSANTLGAVLGAALANFFLLEQLGSLLLLWLTAGGNFALGLTAWRIAARLPARAVETDSAAEEPVESTLPAKPAARHKGPAAPEANAAEREPAPTDPRFLYFASGVVGFAFFLMEMVWYRMLGPLLGGTTYTFGLILCTALAGIGLGGGVYHWIAPRLQPRLPLFAVTCALEALCLALPFWWGDDLAFFVLRGQEAAASSFAAQIWEWTQVCAVVVFPAAAIAGFQFPLLVAMAGSGNRDVSRHVGLTLGANTLGAIAGSILGGFVALPLLTAPVVWQGVAALLVILAFIVALSAWRGARVTSLIATASAVLAIVAVCAPGPSAVWRHSGIGASRATLTTAGRNGEREFANARRRQLAWEAEGMESSVAITATDGLSFIVNGKSDGNAVADAATQIGLGLVGPLLHPEARSALVIGLGTGESAGWLAAVNSMEHVDVVELEPAVLEMARRCADLNQNVLENPKVAVRFNDAREALLTSKQRFDLIVSEPSNPYRAGVASLYTREFYRAAAASLNERGLFLQWLQAYEVDDRTVRIVLRTLRETFPRVQVWRTRSHDLLLVCGKSEEALQYNAVSLQQQLADPTIGRGLLLAWRANDLEGVLAHYACGEKTLQTLIAGDDSINTDDKNLLEYAFARTVGQSVAFRQDDLDAAAAELGDDVPEGVTGVDRAKLARRRPAMHAALGGASLLPADNGIKTGGAVALAHAAKHEFAAACEAFAQTPPDPQCPIEQLAFAFSLAQTGGEIPDNALQLLAGRSLAEAALLRGIQQWRRSGSAAAGPWLLQGLERLRTDPWPAQDVLEAALDVTWAFVRSAPDQAPAFFAALERPFPGHRVEDKRRIMRYMLSIPTGSDATLEALENLEPFVPWHAEFLQQRARLYKSRNHPLTDTAQRELDEFAAGVVREQ